MKRTPLNRKTPMKRGGWRRRRPDPQWLAAAVASGKVRIQGGARAPLRKKAASGVAGMKHQTWKECSRFIRLRDCLRTTGKRFEGACVTCGRVYPFSKLQAGHFLGGRHNTVLFDERNIAAQCLQCNVLNHGAGAEYQAFMLKTYGQAVIDELMARNKEQHRFTLDELVSLRDKFARRHDEMMRTGKASGIEKQLTPNRGIA